MIVGGYEINIFLKTCKIAVVPFDSVILFCILVSIECADNMRYIMVPIPDIILEFNHVRILIYRRASCGSNSFLRHERGEKILPFV